MRGKRVIILKEKDGPTAILIKKEGCDKNHSPFTAKIKSMLPYLLCIAADFYLLPLLIRDVIMAILMLLIVIPLVCFACSIFYGTKHSLDLFYVASVILLFLPTIFIFYDETAWVCEAIYGIVALAGNAVGMIFYKLRDHRG